MWKDVLVHVDGTQAGRSRVEYCVALATQFGARLTGIHVKPPVDIPPLYKPGQLTRVADRTQAELELNARMAESTFLEAVGKELTTIWHSVEGEPIARLCEYARYADLLVLGQYESYGSAERHPLPWAHSVVLTCARPMLVVPAEHSPPSGQPRVLLAWDGNPHTVRATHDALPLLKRATRLVVITMNPEHEKLSADFPYRELLAGHLQRHGIAVAEHIVLRNRGDDTSGIRTQLNNGAFDLLVMGAYDHSMWFEFLFGGTTQTIMLSAPIPILLSH